MADLIPTGTLFTITMGCYSDYLVEGVFRATKDIDTLALCQTWIAESPEEDKDHYDNSRRLIAYAARNGYIEQVPSMEWHLGDYGLDWQTGGNLTKESP